MAVYEAVGIPEMATSIYALELMQPRNFLGMLTLVRITPCAKALF